MGKSRPQAPAPPDPNQVAAAQTQANRDAALANQSLNMIGQNTPDWSLSYEQTGVDPNTGLPQYTANQQLSESGQQLWDANRGLQLGMMGLANNQIGQIGQTLGQPADASNLPGWADRSGTGPQFGASLDAPQFQTTGVTAPQFQTDGVSAPQFGGDLTAPEYQTGGVNAPGLSTSYVDDFSQDRQRVEDALFERMTPSLQQDQSRLENQLMQQGLTPGSAAWDRSMQNHAMGVNDARTSAILAAGQEQSRMAGLSRDQAMFGNQAAQQGFQNEFGLQDYSNQMGRQGFADQQAIQGRSDQLAQQQFGNQFALQDYGNQMGQQGFQNQFALQDYGNQMAQQGFGNQQAIQGREDALGQQGWQNQQQAAAGQDQQRQQALAEMLALRNQPINELGAMMGMGQLQGPNYAQTPQTNMPTTDVAGIQNNHFNQQQQNYQQQMQQRNQMWGGLFGLGSAAITGGIF